MSRRLALISILTLAIAGAVGAFALMQSGSKTAKESSGREFIYMPGSRSFSQEKLDKLLVEAKKQAELTAKYGPGPVLTEFAKTDFAKDPARQMECHLITHAIGVAAIRRAGGDPRKALQQGSTVCRFGYQHAVLQQAFAGKSGAVLPAYAAKLCLPDNRGDQPAPACAHGAGHGFAMRLGREDLNVALDACSKLSPSAACREGVYMETLFGRERGGLPCRTLETRHKTDCYWENGAQLESDFPARMETCRKAEPGWVGVCFNSLGPTAWRMSLKGIPMSQTCATAGEYRAMCLLGAARWVVMMPPKSDAQAIRLCGQMPDLEAMCLQHLGAVFKSMMIDSKQTPAQRCAKVAAGPARSSCLNEAAREIPPYDLPALGAAAVRVVTGTAPGSA